MRYKWMGIIFTCQFNRFVASTLYNYTQCFLADILSHAGGKCGIYTTFTTNEVHIYLANYQLWLHFKAFAPSQQLAVFINEGIAWINYIGRRFAESTGTINIAWHATSTLLTEQLTKVVVLANAFVSGREVTNNISSFQCQNRTGRDRCPHIFTYLHAKDGFWGFKQHVVCHGY